ncbi:MAG: transcription termination/antitermination factor NusG [Oscillospiraceae bacterium]|nr:transcription termination/antitermination factor NusG [Oscillospiraceae bacterium]
MSDSASWYVIHTYSGYENAVAETIRRSVENRKMQDLILETNIPMETVTEITDSQAKTTQHKMFPGYVFVKMVMTDESWHLVRNVRGVTGFVGCGNKAIPLTEDEIAAFGVEKEEVVVNFSVGNSVKVTDGPLEGFFGVIDDIDVEKRRVRVIVSMFGRETPVDLDFDQIAILENS